MRLFLIALLIHLPVTATAAPKNAYDGLWGTNAKACRDADGTNRMEINNGGQRFFWYETRCVASAVAPDGPRAWRMKMACEGEGDRFTKRPRLSLPSPGKLVLEDGPVGRAKRQTYVRCVTPPAR
jgi:hypothetical protein